MGIHLTKLFLFQYPFPYPLKSHFNRVDKTLLVKGHSINTRFAVMGLIGIYGASVVYDIVIIGMGNLKDRMMSGPGCNG